RRIRDALSVRRPLWTARRTSESRSASVGWGAALGSGPAVLARRAYGLARGCSSGRPARALQCGLHDRDPGRLRFLPKQRPKPRRPVVASEGEPLGLLLLGPAAHQGADHGELALRDAGDELTGEGDGPRRAATARRGRGSGGHGSFGEQGYV